MLHGSDRTQTEIMDHGVSEGIHLNDLSKVYILLSKYVLNKTIGFVHLFYVYTMKYIIQQIDDSARQLLPVSRPHAAGLSRKRFMTASSLFAQAP